MIVGVYIIKISLTNDVRNITQYEFWFHMKPNVSHFEFFGGIEYALIDKNDQ